MKKFSTFLLFMLLSLISFSQEIRNAQKIIDVYGQQFYDQQLATNPGHISLLDKYIDHGFKLKVVSEGKYEDVQQPLEFIPLLSKTGETITVDQFVLESQSENFNPLRYGYFPSPTEAQIFKLKGYNLILYVYPQNSFLNK